ncbi:phosphatase PAP2 family protein [Stenotrophomonas sp. SY1]|uniref:phosphatase PAP2 family protein n=1 Tax=Stenotrophomonas sp. SY1 TaxID=477235 RepID=UPI002FC3CE29
MPRSTPAHLLSAPLPSTRLGFINRTLLIPSAVLAIASVVLMAGGGDQWIADQLYRLQGSQWALRDAWWTSHLLHKGGRNLSTLAALLVILGLIRTCFNARLRPLRKPLLYLLLAVALSTGVVSLLKSWTGMDCPWDLERYGGLRPFIGLLQVRPTSLGHAACFPAGHASAGYAWVALYFFMLQVRPQWRWPALIGALTVGATFGIAQQLRGAHFLSHDLWALAISWAVATLLYAWLFDPTSSIAPTTYRQKTSNGDAA